MFGFVSAATLAASVRIFARLNLERKTMSIRAQNWAWEQVLPIKPKHVLCALADQAHERTGHVCYGRTDLEYLARKCSLARRSLSRIIAALMRNKYVLRQSGKGKGAASEYWLCLDRAPSGGLADFKWTADRDSEIDPDGEDVDSEPQDVDGWANLAHPPEAPKQDSDDAQIGPGGGPIGGPARVLDNYHTISTRAQGTGFDPEAQSLEIQAYTQKRAAEAAGAKTFVIEGTPAWKAWCVYRKQKIGIGSLPTANGTGKYAGRTGWYMPTLFPPDWKPPTEDQKFIAQNGGL